MKLKPDANIPKFLQAVSECRGAVHFTTAEGDNLNLKSSLSQFVFAAVIAGQLQKFDGEIVVKNSTDRKLLSHFFA